jgi:hypothetical protein
MSGLFGSFQKDIIYITKTAEYVNGIIPDCSPLKLALRWFLRINFLHLVKKDNSS